MTNPFAATAPAPAVPTTPPPPTVSPFSAPPAAPVAPVQPVAPPVATATEGDPFSGPAPQRPRGPRMRDMHGRLLLIRPLFVEKHKSTDPTTHQETEKDRMTADVIILDGGPIHFGGTPEKLPSIPHDRVADVPFKIDGMFISAVGIISQCRDALEKKRRNESGAIVLGRLGVGQARNADSSPPYLLSPYTEAEANIARAYLAQVDPFA